MASNLDAELDMGVSFWYKAQFRVNAYKLTVLDLEKNHG